MVTQNYNHQTRLSIPAVGQEDNPVSQLKQEYEYIRTMFALQPALVQRFLEAQASQVADAFVQRQAQISFVLPDQVLIQSNTKTGTETRIIPKENRQQITGGLVERLARNDSRLLLRQRLTELELSAKSGLALAARLLRYTIADTMVNRFLPSGRSVTYVAVESEEMPTVPVGFENDPASAITADSDAIVEESKSIGRGQLQVPYTPAARRFYLPQWVALDETDQLLTSSLEEAEARIASMQRYLEILHAAISLAPYMVADPAYQQKRYGMLGQLVNQGRSLASYETKQIIRKIGQRATSQELNRGLSVSLPYFDEQALQMRFYNFDIIPAGRIMFIPAFVVRAVQQEQVKVAQDTRLSPSTRKYLLAELETLERAFE